MTETQRTQAERLNQVVDALNVAEQKKFDALGYTHAPDVWHTKEGKKYTKIDCGTSGAFMVEKATGELFNIKGYGTADKNKKRRSNLGNIATVDPVFLHQHRFNYTNGWGYSS